MLRKPKKPITLSDEIEMHFYEAQFKTGHKEPQVYDDDFQLPSPSGCLPEMRLYGFHREQRG